MSEDPTIAGAEDDMIAAEYVLGVLDAAQRREVERRLAREPALAAEVAFWEQRLGALAEGIPPVTPPAQTWSRIEAALAPNKTAAPARNLAFWRWAAIGSAGLAVASLAGLLYVAVAPSPRAPLVATLEAGGQTGFIAAIDRGGTSMTVVPAAVKNVDQRALQLWLIAPGDTPRSLGLVDGERPVRINVPANLLPLMTADAALAVSVEPPGGSPTGLPTGPVIASGKLTNL
jgi:anti-sigma-K factor RskA